VHRARRMGAEHSVDAVRGMLRRKPVKLGMPAPR
jgi:hypothetical protein